jgi:regulator of replication initiation timing
VANESNDKPSQSPYSLGYNELAERVMELEGQLADARMDFEGRKASEEYAVSEANRLHEELNTLRSHGGERLDPVAVQEAWAKLDENTKALQSATAPRSDVYALVDAVATMFSKHPGEMTNWPEWDAVSLAFHKLPEAHVEIVAAESRTKEKS